LQLLAPVGGTLGKAWLKLGHDAVWGVRNAADPKYASLPKERLKSPAEAVNAAEIVVIATPWTATEVTVKSLGSKLADKIVIDCTNPLGVGPDGLQLVLGFETSAAEQIASWAPGAFVFKTLNTTGSDNMENAANYPVKPLMLVAGDNAEKKPVVMDLVRMLSFEPIDAGPLKNARLLLARSGISLLRWSRTRIKGCRHRQWQGICCRVSFKAENVSNNICQFVGIKHNIRHGPV
jgi:predicted dinucleotide-binding enzyme